MTFLIVSGADLMDGTPIYDIKPYLPYADAHPEALGGFARRRKRRSKSKARRSSCKSCRRGGARRCSDVLACRTRAPQYQNDPLSACTV